MRDLEAFLRDLFGDPSLTISPEVRREIVLHPGLDEAALDEEAKAHYRLLPEQHQRLLRFSDGLEILGSSYRLFSLGRIVEWNRSEAWKFAWGDMADPYLCIGESVLGNQDAYLRDELGPEEPVQVYELYAVTLEPIVTYGSFEEYVRDRFVSPPDDSYTARIRKARQKLGGFRPDQLLVYTPSPLLLGGQLDVQELMPMDAKSAMIVNGDLASQIAWRDSLDGFQRLEAYEDEKGRARVRARWEGE
jgi:hypothetical protein